jgi:hypothetical protein
MFSQITTNKSFLVVKEREREREREAENANAEVWR